MFSNKKRVSSGVEYLDQVLDGLFIGDNVLLYDDVGSLAYVFCQNFIKASQTQNKPLIYVSFDRSPRNLLEKLGPLAENQNLTILDCFTNGKGDGSEVFNKFYEKDGAQWPYQIIKINEPWKPDQVVEAIYGLHKGMKGDVRLVFESLTGMQDLWGGEDHILKFYSRTCPQLYELDTVAYWILEKEAHSSRLKAHINQVAQVAIDLALKRGKSILTVLKAEKRNPDTLNKPISFWTEGLSIHFESDKRVTAQIDLGHRIKGLRTKQGMSQKKLAQLIGVTPSTISQIESNSIYPSLPALFKISEVLSVDVGSFFGSRNTYRNRILFDKEGGVEIRFPDIPKGNIRGKLVTPVGYDGKAEIYMIEIPARKTLPCHFFADKGEEIGHVLSGKLKVTLQEEYQLKPGDSIYLTTDTPSQWENMGLSVARLLWIKIK
ncbi:MAG: helix-turn-helix domain-containing protein [Proteobacteria bacterium]|nr:helix-turn-helix domain-containing protein [Pseudomonadota bacterium]